MKFQKTYEKQIRDSHTGEIITFHHRRLTAEDKDYYNANIYERNGDKITVRSDTYIESALNVITGFPDGTFEDESGKISSNTNSSDYRENWKEILAKNVPDLLYDFAVSLYGYAPHPKDIANSLGEQLKNGSESPKPLIDSTK